MAKDQGMNMPTVQRPKGETSRPSAPAAAPAAPKKPFNPALFIAEVRAEARKIHWTSWKETWITSVMVLIMVVATALFLRVVDVGLGFVVQQILKLA